MFKLMDKKIKTILCPNFCYSGGLPLLVNPCPVEIQLNPGLSFLEKTVDPDQLASVDASLSGSIMFSNLIENTHYFNWNAAS